jgi:hypothetical protein
VQKGTSLLPESIFLDGLALCRPSPLNKVEGDLLRRERKEKTTQSGKAELAINFVEGGGAAISPLKKGVGAKGKFLFARGSTVSDCMNLISANCCNASAAGWSMS